MQSPIATVPSHKNYIDYIRSYSALAVVTIHCTGAFFAEFDGKFSTDWWIANTLNSFSRFSVPIFLMVSGAVLLGKSISTPEFYRRRLVRLLPPILFWNLLYLFFSIYKGLAPADIFWFVKTNIFLEGKAEYHLWYLSMFFCIMLFAPFINLYLKGQTPSSTDHKLLVAVFFLIFTLQGTSLVSEVVFQRSIEWHTSFPWYIAYFVFGFLVDRGSILKETSTRLLLSIVLLLSIFGALANYYIATTHGIFSDSLIMSNTGPIVFTITITLFCYLRKVHQESTPSVFIKSVSNASFGIYLIHPIFIYVISNQPIWQTSSIPLKTPILIVSVSILSYLSTISLRYFRFFRIVS